MSLYRAAVHHVKIKTQSTVLLTMLKRLDKIRFRGQRRDEFLDLAESPNNSDSECNDDIMIKPPRTSSAKDLEELAELQLQPEAQVGIYLYLVFGNWLLS